MSLPEYHSNAFRAIGIAAKPYLMTVPLHTFLMGVPMYLGGCILDKRDLFAHISV